jgi:deazaflavin-dependent oxidoreductase (nitroreductase family)
VTEYDDWNRRVVDEFRGNGGKVAQFEGRPLLLLHHTGAKTGTERVNPLVYLPMGDDFAVFGSKAGADTNPAWYHNLRAHPDTTIEVGTETLPVHARVARAPSGSGSGKSKSARTRTSQNTSRRRRARFPS